MKRWLLALGLMGLGFSSTVVLAEEGDDDSAVPKERTARRTGRSRPTDALRDELRFTAQLREAVIAELDLSEEQKTKLNQDFQDHSESLQQVARAPREDEGDESVDERMAELQRQAEAARNAGDREEARRLQQEAMELRRGGAGHQAGEIRRLHEELLETVKGQLTEEQQPRFDRIVQRLTDQAETGGSAMRLMQAGRRAAAKMELDEDQRKQVNEILRDTVRSAIQEGDRSQDPDAMIAALRGRVVEALGAETGEQFMQALEREQAAMVSRGPGPRGARVRQDESAPAQPERSDSEEPADKGGDED